MFYCVFVLTKVVVVLVVLVFFRKNSGSWAVQLHPTCACAETVVITSCVTIIHRIAHNTKLLKKLLIMAKGCHGLKVLLFIKLQYIAKVKWK